MNGSSLFIPMQFPKHFKETLYWIVNIPVINMLKIRTDVNRGYLEDLVTTNITKY